jgi:mono/diheme cytochrome c family protein
MSERVFLGVFDGEEGLLRATRAVRERGWRVRDVYTPYAVHGLDEALGLPSSRLSRFCLVCGAVGVALAFWAQYWTMTIDWPLNVGGRPWNSLPAFVPVAFELMVLFAGFGVVLAFLGVSRLFPGKRAVLPVDGVTRDRFALLVTEGDAAFDPAAIRPIFEDCGAVSTEERELSEGPPASPAGRGFSLAWWNAVLGVGLLLIVLLNWGLGDDRSRPNDEMMPEMVHSVPYNSYAPNPNFADGATLQRPQPGTIAHGHLPLHYKATPEDAVRAGEELANPVAADDARARQRGPVIFSQYCQVCHGPAGQGDGPVAKRGIPPPPPLTADKARLMKDGQLFHVLTYGQGNMASYAAQVPREDRWFVILHVRELQKQAARKVSP